MQTVFSCITSEISGQRIYPAYQTFPCTSSGFFKIICGNRVYAVHGEEDCEDISVSNVSMDWTRIIIIVMMMMITTVMMMMYLWISQPVKFQQFMTASQVPPRR